MTVLLLFILAAQGCAATVMASDVQVAGGPTSGRQLVGTPDFRVVTRTPATESADLSPDATRIMLWHQKEVPGAFGDISERAFPIHTEGPRWTMRIALECLEGAALKFQLDGGEFQARAQLERSSVCNLLDAFMMLPRLSQGANISEMEAWKACTPAQLSHQRRPLARVGSTADKTAVLAREMEFALTMHFHVKKREAGLLRFFPRVAVQDIYSLKPFPKVGYWLGNRNVKLDPLPLFPYRGTGILRRWLLETNVPRTIWRTHRSCFHRSWFQDAVQRRGSGARIQNAHSLLVQSIRQKNNALPSLLGNRSVESSLPSRVNPATARPTGPSRLVPKPIPYKKPFYPEGSKGQAKPLYLFRGHRPYVKQIFYIILRNQECGCSSEVLDKSESLVIHRGFLDNLPGPFCAVLVFSFVFTYLWVLERFFQSVGIANRWPDRPPFEDEHVREFRRSGERIVRHLYRNVLKPF